MENVDIILVFSLLSVLVGAISFFFSFSSAQYAVENILHDEGDDVFIAHLPKARLHKRFGKQVAKSSIVTVQLAGNIVSLFTKSGNAIDIWTPKNSLAQPIFEEAKSLFSDAQSKIITV